MKALWLALSTVALVSAKPSCRCLYGKECWPRQSDFAELASRLSQPLLHPKPAARGCYPAANPSGNCAEVLSSIHNGRWRAQQPGAMQIANFETYIFDNGTISACYANTTLGSSCGQGSVPTIGVDARTVSDVQAAIRFAAQHNLRFVIKNTGHDFLGRSTARGAFLLWMHNFKNITYHDAFLPKGAPSHKNYRYGQRPLDIQGIRSPSDWSSQAITLGAGVQWFEAYAAAKKHNRFLVGAISAGGSVGAAGGWIQGGGHSSFSPRYGLGVDNVIQFTVITSSGKFLTTSSYQNSDLFWALRGGGGGTYAVLVSATYITHDRFALSDIKFQANFSSPEMAKIVTTEWVKMHPRLSDAGWGGFGSLSTDSLYFLYMGPNISVATANATFDSFVELSSKLTNGQAGAIITPFDSFDNWYSASLENNAGIGDNLEIGSRLLHRDLAKNDPAKAADVMLSVEDGVGFNLVAGGTVSRVDPDSTGLHPDWREAIIHVVSGKGWDDGASASFIQQARQRIRTKLDIMDGLGSAAYLNEASLYERDFKRTFFGTHYDKLKNIKTKYDPDDLFVVPRGVGSDEWDEELICLRGKKAFGLLEDHTICLWTASDKSEGKT